MTKWDLVSITLDQLISQWGVSQGKRDRFDVTWVNSGSQCDTIIRWDPRGSVLSPEDSNTHTPKLIQITFRRISYFEGMFECTITDVSGSPFIKEKEKNIKSHKSNFVQFTKLYRRFKNLEKNIIRYKKAKENNSFLEDLMKVFPTLLDGEILGEDYKD